MRVGLRWRLVVASVLLLVVAVVIARGVAARTVGDWLAEREWTRLEQEARTLAVALEGLPRAEQAAAIPALAEAAGLSVELVDAAGASVAAAGASLRGPEGERAWRLALQGHAARARLTPGAEALMLAVPAGEGALAVGVEAARVDAARERLDAFVVAAGLAGLALAALMAALASYAFAQWLHALLAYARRIIARADGSEPGVAGGLAGSVDRVGRQLEQAVDALASERARARRVIEALDEGVLALDARGAVTVANPAARALLGIDDSAVGRPLAESVRTPGLLEIVGDAGRGRAGQGEIDADAGAARRLAVHATPMGDQDGTVVALRDVTELRRLEGMRRDLVANVSHEIRTPISVIRANAETLLDGALDDPPAARRFSEAIHRHSERLSQLVSDLLDLARIEAGQRRLKPRQTALAEVIERARAALESVAAARGQVIDVDVASAPQVLADAGALEQILVNLVENAVKYGVAGGRVAITARGDGDSVRVEVVDDGPGIPRHHLPRVFERFYRVDAGRSREQGGTGLGLSIVKHLVQGLGGEVGVEPARPDDLERPGCRFWLNLPRAPS